MLKPKWITKIAATVNPHSSTPGKFYSDSTALRVLHNQLIVVNPSPSFFLWKRQMPFKKAPIFCVGRHGNGKWTAAWPVGKVWLGDDTSPALEAPIFTSKNDVMMQAVCKLSCPFSIFPMAIKTPRGRLEGMDGLTWSSQWRDGNVKKPKMWLFFSAPTKMEALSHCEPDAIAGTKHCNQGKGGNGVGSTHLLLSVERNISLRRFVSLMARKVRDQHGWFLGKHFFRCLKQMDADDSNLKNSRFVTDLRCNLWLWYINLFGPFLSGRNGWLPVLVARNASSDTPVVGILEDSMASELMRFCVSRCMVVQNIGQRKTTAVFPVLIHPSIWSSIGTILKERCG